MPYKVKGKCVYKKDTGKKVGCTKGPVKKYLAALHINAHENMETFKDYQKRTYKETFLNTIAGDQKVTDTQHSNIGETQYSDGQDYSIPASPIVDATNKEQVIQDIINDLEDLKTQHNWTKPVNNDIIRAMASTLREIGVEPTDLDASIGVSPEEQEQYMITGPSSWKGGNGALNDLKAILAGREPQEIEEDESVPSSDLPYGSADSNPGMADLSEMKCWKGYTRVKGKRPGTPGSCKKVKENFIDKKGPGRPGDSKRHGIKKKPSLASLDKIVKSKSASPRKKQLAHWQANMRRGKAHKKESVTGTDIGKQGIVENITVKTIHRLADRKGIPWDNEPSFLKLTKRLTGKEHLDDLDQAGLKKVQRYLMKQDVAEGS